MITKTFKAFTTIAIAALMIANIVIVKRLTETVNYTYNIATQIVRLNYLEQQAWDGVNKVDSNLVDNDANRGEVYRYLFTEMRRLQNKEE